MADDAAASALVERSEATISIDQSGSVAASDMAIEYGSSPVEHPALQTRIDLRRSPQSAAARQAGRMCSSRNANCLGSRKKLVSLVQMASIICTSAARSLLTWS